MCLMYLHPCNLWFCTLAYVHRVDLLGVSGSVHRNPLVVDSIGLITVSVLLPQYPIPIKSLMIKSSHLSSH